jgi:hypothetical protein
VKVLDEPRRSFPSDDLYEELCTIADDAARKYITSKVSNQEISDLTVSVNLEESERLNVEVDVDLTLSRMKKPTDEKRLAEEAVKAAFKAIDKYISEAKCQLKT